MPDFSYDMLVIGSGPAGQRAAIQAAKLNKRTALLERKSVIGGVCINSGTIPSKTLREAALYLTGYRLRGLYGASYTATFATLAPRHLAASSARHPPDPLGVRRP